MKKIALILAVLMCAAVLFSCGDPKPKDILDDDGNKIAVGYYDGDKLVYEEKTDSNGSVVKKTSYDDEERVEKVEDFYHSKLQKESVYTYGDKEGEYTVKATTYNNKGVAVRVSETKYEDARPVSESRTVPSADGKKNAEESKYSYKDDGSVVETITSNGKKIRQVKTDGNGVVIYDHEYSEAGSSVKTYYDEEKRISKVENFNADGDMVVSIVNQYGSDGKISRTESFDKDGSMKDYSEYVYKEGSLAAIYKYYADGTIQSTITYDADGKATVHSGVYLPLD